jgi:hypothetical protein
MDNTKEIITDILECYLPIAGLLFVLIAFFIFTAGR